jgi:dihydroxy-acid dehydratase
MKLPSRTLYEGPERAPARAQLKGIGFTDEDLQKPIIGIANTWIGTMPCNWLLRDIAVEVARGIREAGGTPMEFNTIAISDGITMGTQGMKTSLISREVIADSIELVTRGHMFDGLVCLVACDKTIPGAALALLRLNIPGLILYGGSILPGRYHGRDVTIQEVFEAVGAFAAGRISKSEFKHIEDCASPGAGACGGQFTANTMATAARHLHPPGLRERHRQRCRHRRLHQRRAAPAGHGQRSRRGLEHRRLQHRQRAHAAIGQPAPGRRVRRCRRR